MTRQDEHRTLLLQKEKSIYTDPLISFLIFAWTLAGFMIRSIPLSDSRAAWIQNNPSDTQLIATLISTIFALIGSFCLCEVAQYALVRRLTCGPLALATMTEWAKLAQRTISLSADRRKRSWTLFSIAWISLLGFLTTAWVTLLAPQNIVISSAGQGNQTYLLHPSVSSIFANVLTSSPQPPPGFNLTPGYTLKYCNPYMMLSNGLARNLMEAGFFAAVANANVTNKPTTNLIGIPGMDFSSNISTGGISPPGFDLEPFDDHFTSLEYEGLSQTWSVTQQGFTANVICKATAKLPMSDVPVIKPNPMDSVQFSIDGDSSNTWTQGTYSWSTTCSTGVTYSTYGITVVSDTTQDQPPDYNLLMASVCFGQDFNGLSNQSFLVLLSASSDSRYAGFAQTCEVTPLVTTVQATYSAAGVVRIAQPPLEQHPLPDPIDTYNTSVLLWFPAYIIWMTIVGSQGLDRNELAENLNSLSLVPINPTILTEDYLRGMVDYLGSILNNIAMLAIDSNVDNPADIPAAMIVQSNGTLHTQTLGWSFHLRTHGPSLAAITLVALLTVALGVFAMLPIPPPHNASPAQGDAWKLLNPSFKLAHRFNPTATMDVLLASAAGDLSKVLNESGAAYRRGDEGVGVGVGKQDEDGAGAGEGVRGVRERLGVKLETTGEGWPALRTVSLDSVVKDRTGVGLGGLRFLRARRGGRASADDVQRDEYIELGEVPQEGTE